MSTVETLVTPLGRLLRTKRAGEQFSVRNADQLAATDRIELSSPVFDNGATIPDRYSSRGRGDNISPALRWGGLPAGTRQLLLIIEDIDTPGSRPGMHTIALFAPDGPGLDEGTLTPDNPRFRYVPNHRGRTGYVGPRPLPGHGTHHYGFHLYALDDIIDPDTVDTLSDLLARVVGHILASGMIEGMQTG